jgi:hypothetical protein
MLAADVVIYEKTGVLHVIGPLAGNDNSAAAGWRRLAASGHLALSGQPYHAGSIRQMLAA